MIDNASGRPRIFWMQLGQQCSLIVQLGIAVCYTFGIVVIETVEHPNKFGSPTLSRNVLLASTNFICIKE